MAKTLAKENFVLHKLHSLTGIVPVGYYLVQHLVLNSFSLAGPDHFNGVIDFFESMPKFFLPIVEALMIWIPLAFHAIYGLIIADRSQGNYFTTKYKWSQNRMYSFQRYSGVFILAFLMYHVTTTTGYKYIYHDANAVKFAAWHEKLTSYGYFFLLVYALGVLVSSYHFCYGIWNFCIRWGITVSDEAQMRIQKFSGAAFVALTVVGWAALIGFLVPHSNSSTQSGGDGSSSTTAVSYKPA